MSEESPEELLKKQIENCIFCKIVNGEMDSRKVFEDENFFAFLDINPSSEGHAVIVPKQHLQVAAQLPPELSAKLAILVQELSRQMLKNLGASGTTFVVGSGVAAGQRLPHVSFHLIPTYKNKVIKSEEKELDVKVAEKVKEGLGA